MEGLESQIVNKALVREAIEDSKSGLSVRKAIERLVSSGWLIPLRTSDAWEFVPARHGGRACHSDRWIDLKAALLKNPDLPVAVSFGSALWYLGHKNNPSDTMSLAKQADWRPPVSLNHISFTSYDWRLPPITKDGLPLWQTETAVVAVAALPSKMKDWANFHTWYKSALHYSEIDNIMLELKGRSVASHVRLGYMANKVGFKDLVKIIKNEIPSQRGAVFLGEKNNRSTWVNEWRLYDSLIQA